MSRKDVALDMDELFRSLKGDFQEFARLNQKFSRDALLSDARLCVEMLGELTPWDDAAMKLANVLGQCSLALLVLHLAAADAADAAARPSPSEAVH